MCLLSTGDIQSNNTIKQLKKLMKNNHPDAFIMMANNYKTGDLVFQSDTKALEMYTRAAELGHVEHILRSESITMKVLQWIKMHQKQ